VQIKCAITHTHTVTQLYSPITGWWYPLRAYAVQEGLSSTIGLKWLPW